MNVDEIYASSLNHKHLNGQDMTVTIAGGEVRDFDGKRKIVLRFSELWRPLVVNKTNAKAIAAALGTGEVTQWPGRQITLCVSQCEYGGNTVPCVRVRQKATEAPRMAVEPTQQPESGAQRF